MTETAQTVFEEHQIRKSRKQKTAFIDYVQATAASLGYDSHTEKGYLGARNVVVGDPDTAKVVYTAHYDTCAIMPFPNFITPKCIWLFLLYQIAVGILMVAIPSVLVTGIFFGLAACGIEADALLLHDLWLILILAVCWFIMAGPANKHTANDNTSGVTTLLDIMTALPEELHGEVAFVFFDLEEMGLFGSAGFASKHKKVTKNTLVVNFDCVSDGNTILFVLRKGAVPYAETIRTAFPSTESFTVEVASKGAIYPSDQANFARGVGVAALKKTKGGLLYMDRIHTKRDTVYMEENIAYLTEGAVCLAESLREK
ncbi:MAG: M28 family peptidase [Clostridia bacterium]|nr:M28 family peptidase [Clostridia bacterium]